ncbi:putative endonuclease [Nicoletella semolina]|uniref:UPF0102 protein EV693_101196 n=1 Tax=Nicoletella semolina TaxID=271160 RepID=A0A4R2NCK3_9PAST|nr:YraN family protein [Nicoletella semolina]MDH2924175.1 hypothetical protein [Nicoletella semolina]TCP18929.1 putative endonuclease [Nicoletella semolina]
MRAQGQYFEAMARKFLERQGLKWIAQNQTFRCGELDLIMQHGKTIVFVEVRQRKNAHYGSAVESISYSKQQKWLKAANLWLAKQNKSLDTADCRFDVVAFEGHNSEMYSSEEDKSPIWIQNFLD